MNLLAYLGPETMLPMTSILAGAVGLVMMFGRKAVELVSRPFRKTPAAVVPQTRSRGHRPTSSRTVIAGPEANEKSESESESESAAV